MQGDDITSACVIAESFVRNNKKYYRMCEYTLSEGSYVIKNRAFVDNMETSLALVDCWAGLPEEIIIGNVERMLFATCPADSRRANFGRGVSVTYGAESLINDAKGVLKDIADEYSLKKPMIAISEIAYDDKEKKLPSIFKTFPGIDNSDFWQLFNPDIRDVADSGLRSVDYATGYSRRLDTAVRQNVLWALKECNQQVSDMTGSEFGADGFEVSYHSNPRPSHVAMGGRMFSNKGDKRLNGKLYPDGTIAKELLSEYGCLHFAFYVLLGISPPTISQDELSRLKAEDAKKIEFEGVKMTKYEASQKQRQIETKVRHLKDRANIAKASGDDELRRETQTKINLLTSKYAKLSKSANLPTKMERLGVRGFRAVKPSNKLFESINEKGINKINNGEYNTIVNLKYINSKEYRDKFDTITDNKNVNSSIHRYSKAILTHRTGTDFEDLYIVDANTEKFVAKETSAKVKHEVQYSKKVEAIVKKNPNKLISLHNHSSNNPPTGSDLVSNGNRKYIKGVVACHNGEVFVYSAGDKVFSRTFFDLNVDKFRKRGYNDIKAHEETLDLFKKEFGIDWRRL